MNKLNQRFLRMSLQDQILFSKRLSMLIKAGVPITQALGMLKKQANNRTSTHILGSLLADVEHGQFLSAGLAKFRRIFGIFAINIVQVGEVSGNLTENLNYLAEELQKKQALRRKIVGALVYPIFILCATLGVTVLLTAFVFPKILPIFESFNFKLPWTTKALIFVSNLFIHHWLTILGIVVVLVGGFILLMRWARFRYGVHRFILFIPFFGRMMASYYLSNMFRTMGLLLKSDVQIVKAATITAETTTNLVYQRHLYNMVLDLTRGDRMSNYFELNQKLFPPIASQMVSVGESTGNLSGALTFLADMYEGEVEELTRNSTTVLEPALMVFMGLVVGFIAISIITPIYGITQNLHP